MCAKDPGINYRPEEVNRIREWEPEHSLFLVRKLRSKRKEGSIGGRRKSRELKGSLYILSYTSSASPRLLSCPPPPHVPPYPAPQHSTRWSVSSSCPAWSIGSIQHSQSLPVEIHFSVWLPGYHTLLVSSYLTGSFFSVPITHSLLSLFLECGLSSGCPETFDLHSLLGELTQF